MVSPRFLPPQKIAGFLPIWLSLRSYFCHEQTGGVWNHHLDNEQGCPDMFDFNSWLHLGEKASPSSETGQKIEGKIVVTPTKTRRWLVIVLVFFYWEGMGATQGLVMFANCLLREFFTDLTPKKKVWQFINPKTVGCRKTCFYQALPPPENERMSTLKRDEPTIHFQGFFFHLEPQTTRFKVDGNGAFQPFPM